MVFILVLALRYYPYECLLTIALGDKELVY